MSQLYLYIYIYSSCRIIIFLVEIISLLCDNFVILGKVHFTLIKGQHIVGNLLLINPFQVVLYLNYLPDYDLFVFIIDVQCTLYI